MFKVMIGLTRRAAMSHAQFADWWLNDHAPLARTLPGIRRIQFNLLEESEDAPFDGIAELWFDSEVAMSEAYASQTGQAVAADSIAHVSSRVRMPVQVHPILD